MISASGGHGACVPYCGNCAEKRRCVSCTHGRYLQNYQCKSYKDSNEPLVSMVKIFMKFCTLLKLAHAEIFSAVKIENFISYSPGKKSTTFSSFLGGP